jgi:SP family sugar:H+ symporter-like MFS transporter
MDEVYQPGKGHPTTFWEERRVIFICFLIGFAQFQYGYDSAAVSGFQSMPGFLRIFGYPAVGSF